MEAGKEMKKKALLIVAACACFITGCGAEKSTENKMKITESLHSAKMCIRDSQERNEGRYAAKGYHQLLIDNYIAIFRIDEPNKTVYVVTIQYQGWNL